MIADAIKGNQLNEYPPEIKKGILLHRSIDAYTDQHELVKQSRKIFYPAIRHYALVISDVIHDHFLGTNWTSFSEDSLEEFSKRSFADLDAHQSYFPEKFKRIYPYMKEHNWFVMYATRPGIEGTIERLSYRSKNFIWAKETIDIFNREYDELEKLFMDFFPQLVEHSKDFLKKE